jgi:hypothetical protein
MHIRAGRYRWPGAHRPATLFLFLLPVTAVLVVGCTGGTSTTSPSSGSADATATATVRPYDLTKSPRFQTPDGNISCGLPNFQWSSSQSAQPSYLSQALDCRIMKHSVAPVNCSDLPYEASPAVYLAPGEYASFTCLSQELDLPMDSIEDSDGGLKSRPPYQARAGQDINLGPATCAVAMSSVDCTSSDGKHGFHLDSASFRSPLLPGDTVLAAQNAGAMNTNANTGMVRPAKYLIGNDGSFDGISWTQWTAQQATGTAATYQFNKCQPECAAGNYQTDDNVTIKFIDPMVVCGQWFFTKLSVQDSETADATGQFPITPDAGAHGSCLPPSNG